MPGRDDHLGQAHHNFTFYGTLNTATYGDWAVTVLFYTSLHYIDAFLATKQIHPGSHDNRDRLVGSIQELRPISGNYFFLKNSSRNARYNPPTPFTAAHISALENTHLAGIRTQLRQYVPI